MRRTGGIARALVHPHPEAPSLATSITARILALYGHLEAAATVDPGPGIDPVFRELVSLCGPDTGDHVAQVLDDPEIIRHAPRIRELCAEGEYRLERAWARRVIAADDPWSVLEDFPYLDNYVSLTRLELHAVWGAGIRTDRGGRVCFLGGGPLPVSALMLGRLLPASVDVVDHDTEAVALAGSVCARLGVSSVRVHHAEAARFTELGECDLVILAALVGADARQKRALLQDLYSAMRPGSAVVIRSARGLRTLMYPALDLRDLAGWTPVAVIHPLTDVVNSVVVAVRGAG